VDKNGGMKKSALESIFYLRCVSFPCLNSMNVQTHKMQNLQSRRSLWSLLNCIPFFYSVWAFIEVCSPLLNYHFETID